LKKITLSYVLTTFNKLEYLKVSLPNLLDNLKDDEEIVITDGGSSDGTSEYLEDLHSRGLIHQYVSEPDIGQAHGINKAILMATGD
jgi:glycosyltransferase involved in cell wall biosynthesis